MKKKRPDNQLSHVCLSGFLACFLILVPALSGFASSQFDTEPLEVFTGAMAAPWERVERLIDRHPGFVHEAFAPEGVQTDPRIIRWFGGDKTPHSNRFLLHCFRDYSKRTFPTPVLLIHGSVDNANRGWVHPYDMSGSLQSLPPDKVGFACRLADLGYAVFAITFAHGQGDNIMQAEQVANAIRRIRILLGREKDPDFKIDLIAHSKGNVAARLYCSDARSIFPNLTFLTPFRKDVRKYIAIASPMRGIDTPYRYYGYNLHIALNPGNAPMGASKMLINGAWKGFHDRTVFSDSKNYWPGQPQLLFNLVRDGNIPLGIESATADAGASALALYHGGTSLALESRGIDKAIEAGDRLIYRLEEKGIDPSVHLCVLAGNNPYLSLKLPVLGYTPTPYETFSAPYDGLLFVDSAVWTKGILKRGAKLFAKSVIYLNHLDLARAPEAFKLIDTWLMAPTGTEKRSLRKQVEALFPSQQDED
ncbi:MAG: hypothetical protein BWY66_01682 [bacterium ADurb.Bin374]|nr:MAG: hypothetical protein BWY66_01682 [bacterium ADurb.Bin374]